MKKNIFQIIVLLCVLFSVFSCSKNPVDSLLDEYDSLIEAYIPLISDFYNGDSSALTKVDAIKARIEKVEEKITELSSTFSEKQKKRYDQKIEKLINEYKKYSEKDFVVED